MTDDYLTVNFVVQDSGIYMINNQAPVTVENIETSNGFIHIIGSVLEPVTNTTKQWLQKNSEYSIFYAAAEVTGFLDDLDRNIKTDSVIISPVTLLVEPDSVFRNRLNINNLDDLISYLGADTTGIPYDSVGNDPTAVTLMQDHGISSDELKEGINAVVSITVQATKGGSILSS